MFRECRVNRSNGKDNLKPVKIFEPIHEYRCMRRVGVQNLLLQCHPRRIARRILPCKPAEQLGLWYIRTNIKPRAASLIYCHRSEGMVVVRLDVVTEQV